MVDDVMMVFAEKNQVGMIVSVLVRDLWIIIVPSTLRIEGLYMANVGKVIFVNEFNGTIRIGAAVS